MISASVSKERCDICRWPHCSHSHTDIEKRARQRAKTLSDNDLFLELRLRNSHECESRSRAAAIEISDRMLTMREELSAMAKENLALSAKIRLIQK